MSKNHLVALTVALGLAGCGAGRPTIAAAESSMPEPFAPILNGGIYKSPLDARSYRYFELENGMKALVISDPTTDMAAASVDVHVGQFSDPKDRLGLAHFLEHMLFQGTDRFPEADDYRDYIQRNGGQANAGTGAEHTRYFFTVKQEAYLGALDRFARFFVAPRLDAERVRRERNAVHSEFSLKVKDDVRRIHEVHRATSNPAHPFSKFSVGTLETLADQPGRPIWDDMKAFYQAEYSASRMTVAVIARAPVEQLEREVRARFGAVPTHGAPPASITAAPYLPNQLGVRVNVTPLADLRSIELQFPLPPDLPEYDKRAVQYLTSLIGHEGEGSLYLSLKGASWIESLGTGMSRSTDHTLFRVRIVPTKEGFAHIDDIVDRCFQFIRLVAQKSTPALYHDEYSRISKLAFHFAEPMRAPSAVRSAAANLHQYPAAHVLDHYRVYAPFEPAAVTAVLALLTPENMRLQVVGPDLPTDQTEPRYDVPYGSSALPEALRVRWRSSPVDPSLSLPAANPFIASELALKVVPEGAPTVPARLVKRPGFELWHKHDVDFNAPKARIAVEVFAPAAKGDAVRSVLNTLLARMINDSLEGWRYPLREAQLAVQVRSRTSGLVLSVDGFDEKLPLVLDALTDRVLGFEVHADRFAVHKAKLLRALRNQKKAHAINQVLGALTVSLATDLYPAEVRADALEAVTVEQLVDFQREVFKAVDVRVLVHGNLSHAEATAIGEQVSSDWFANAKVAARGTAAARKIPTGEIVQEVAVDHPDSVWAAAYRAQGTGLEERARFGLLARVLKTPFFNELRTKQQLGYSVFAYFRTTDLLPGVQLAIQSARFGPSVLRARVDAFLKAYHQTFKAMPQADFEQIRAGLIANLEEKDTQLMDRSRRYASALYDGVQTFDRRAQIVAILKGVTQQDLVAFYGKVLLGPNSGRVVARTVGSAHSDDTPVAADCARAECMPAKLPEVSRRPL